MAALIWGHPIGVGNKTNPASKEWQAAAWAVQRWQERGYTDDEIARRLNKDDSHLLEFKKHRKVTVADVQDLGSLNYAP